MNIAKEHGNLSISMHILLQTCRVGGAPSREQTQQCVDHSDQASQDAYGCEPWQLEEWSGPEAPKCQSRRPALQQCLGQRHGCSWSLPQTQPKCQLLAKQRAVTWANKTFPQHLLTLPTCTSHSMRCLSAFWAVTTKPCETTMFLRGLGVWDARNLRHSYHETGVVSKSPVRQLWSLEGWMCLSK